VSSLKERTWLPWPGWSTEGKKKGRGGKKNLRFSAPSIMREKKEKGGQVQLLPFAGPSGRGEEGACCYDGRKKKPTSQRNDDAKKRRIRHLFSDSATREKKKPDYRPPSAARAGKKRGNGSCGEIGLGVGEKKGGTGRRLWVPAARRERKGCGAGQVVVGVAFRGERKRGRVLSHNYLTGRKGGPTGMFRSKKKKGSTGRGRRLGDQGGKNEGCSLQ